MFCHDRDVTGLSSSVPSRGIFVATRCATWYGGDYERNLTGGAVEEISEAINYGGRKRKIIVRQDINGIGYDGWLLAQTFSYENASLYISRRIY